MSYTPPAMVTAIGFLMSCLAAAFLASSTTARSRAQALAKSMTTDLAMADHSARTALREVRALHRTLDTHSLVSVADAKGKITTANQKFCEVSGYTQEELIGKDHNILNSGVHPKEFWVEVWRTISSGQSWRGEICNRRKDGAIYWVDSIIMPILAADGRVERYVSIRTEITQRKLTETALSETMKRLRLANEVADLGVWEWSLGPGLVRLDDKMFELYGLEPTRDGMVPFADWMAAIDPADARAQERVLKATAASLGYSEREFRVCCADGQVRTIYSAEIAIRGEDGACERVVGVNKDVTTEREAQSQLEANAAIISRQNGELAALADRAHRVVDDVSHEFRTPLSVIKEFASIISDGIAGPVTDQQAQYLRIMESAVVDLNHMVEDLLDSSKLRAGRLRVERKGISVEELFLVGRHAFARKASVRGLIIEEHIEPGLPFVFADGEKARRVIGNLLTNAIKFTPERSKIVLSATSAGPNAVRISVKDSGPGLSKDDIDQLFGRFRQVSTARTVAAKGFGLGLSIAQELSWLNLGQLDVESTKGKGATFSFTLPVDGPDSVIEHYFDAVSRDDRPADTLALMCVSWEPREGQPDSASVDEPAEFLASVIYPTDLVLPARWSKGIPGGEGNSRTCWLLGRTRSPQDWINRVMQAREEHLGEMQLNLSPLAVDVVATWEVPSNLGEARAEVLGLFEEVVEHAEYPHHR